MSMLDYTRLLSVGKFFTEQPLVPIYLWDPSIYYCLVTIHCATFSAAVPQLYPCGSTRSNAAYNTDVARNAPDAAAT